MFGLPPVLGHGNISNVACILPLRDTAVTSHQAIYPGRFFIVFLSLNLCCQARSHLKYQALVWNLCTSTNSICYRAIGAATVTIPSVAYLLYPNSNDEHGHGHNDHAADNAGQESAADEDSETEKPEEEAAGDEGTSDGDSKDSESSQGSSDNESSDSESGGQTRPDHTVYDAGQGTPETSSDEDPKAGAHEVDSGGNVEGVQFKGATSGGTREGEQGDTRKHIPDAKGGSKKRIESDYGKRQGVSQDEEGDASKGAANVHSGAQEGLSNTDTKHSTDMDNNPDKSKKGEGFVETAKMKGPVDPSRPQVRLYLKYRIHEIPTDLSTGVEPSRQGERDWLPVRFIIPQKLNWKSHCAMYHHTVRSAKRLFPENSCF